MKRNDSTSFPVLALAMAAVYLVIFLTGCTVTLPVAATGNRIGERTGTSKATQVCGAWITGDASIQAAATAGHITRIATVDLRTTNVLGIYIRHTCIVNGSNELDATPADHGR